MKFTELLTSIYGDKLWIERNNFVFWAARKSGLSLGGSIGIAVSRKKMVNQPNDIDFLAHNFGCAQSFIHLLERKLFQRKSYWKTMVNHGTDFCPEGVETHIRFQCFLWLPICIMVLPKGKLSSWRTSQGMQIQNFKDIVSAAKALDERDEKGRITSEVEQSLLVQEENDDPIITLSIAFNNPESEDSLIGGFVEDDKWDVMGYIPTSQEADKMPYQKNK